MMKNILLTIVFIAALFLELASGGELAFWGVRPPLAGAVLFFWFWNMRLPGRLFLAVLGGILMDSISLHPFGTNTAVFMAIAGSTEVLRYFFSNVESLVIRGIGVSVGIFLFLNLAVILGSLVSMINSAPPPSSGTFSSHVFFASLVWASVLPALLIIIEKTIRYYKLTHS